MVNIPKQIIQVWLQGPVSDKIKNNLLLLNPSYKYYFFTEKECLKYIETHFPSQIVDTFHNLKKPAHKSDLFRYCFLYREGGIYIDVDLEFKVPCDYIISNANSSFISAIGAHSNHNFGECTNGLIFTEPSNDIFLHLINFIIRNQNPTDYGLYVKDLYNKLSPKTPYKSYEINNLSYYLYREVRLAGKYYIVDSSSNIIVNTNGHNYV